MLSVVAVQVKSVLDGVKNRKKTFLFFGDELNIVGTVGMFITMNPGYAGRTELPENLKTLFRLADSFKFFQNSLFLAGILEY